MQKRSHISISNRFSFLNRFSITEQLSTPFLLSGWISDSEMFHGINVPMFKSEVVFCRRRQDVQIQQGASLVILFIVHGENNLSPKMKHKDK